MSFFVIDLNVQLKRTNLDYPGLGSSQAYRAEIVLFPTTCPCLNRSRLIYCIFNIIKCYPILYNSLIAS